MDFREIEYNLEQRMIPQERVLTKENKKLMKEVHTLYGLDIFDMEKMIFWSLTEENRLNVAEFKDACRTLFESKGIHKTPLNNAENAKTNEQALINELNTVMPEQLLADLSSGKQSSTQDVKVINTIMENYSLTPPVINVLIHYVLLQSNMKLSKAYMEKIASHWSRAGLKTAEEAMEFAKKQRDQSRRRNHNPPKKEKQVVTNNSLIERDKQTNTSTDEKPFTVFEYRYMEQLHDKYGMNFDVSREIILYGRKVNHNLMINWFLDGVSNYVYRHNEKAVEGTQDLLKVFHNRFVKDFGKD